MSSERSWEATAAEGRNWSEAEGFAAVAAWRASGLSLRAFAGCHGLTAQRIAWWRDRTSEPVAPVGFAAVHVRRADDVVAAMAPVRVRVGEATVEIVDPSRVPSSWVASLVRDLS